MAKLTCWTKEDKEGDKYTTCLQGQKGYKKKPAPKKKKLVIKEKPKPVEIPKKKKLVIKPKPVEVPKRKKLIIKEKPKPAPKKKKLVVKPKPPTITITENPRDNVIPVSRALSYLPDSYTPTTKRINVGKDAPKPVKVEQPAPKKRKMVIKPKPAPAPVAPAPAPAPAPVATSSNKDKVLELLRKSNNFNTLDMIREIYYYNTDKKNPGGWEKMTTQELFKKQLQNIEKGKNPTSKDSFINIIEKSLKERADTSITEEEMNYRLDQLGIYERIRLPIVNIIKKELGMEVSRRLKSYNALPLVKAQVKRLKAESGSSELQDPITGNMRSYSGEARVNWFINRVKGIVSNTGEGEVAREREAFLKEQEKQR